MEVCTAYLRALIPRVHTINYLRQLLIDGARVDSNLSLLACLPIENILVVTALTNFPPWSSQDRAILSKLPSCSIHDGSYMAQLVLEDDRLLNNFSLSGRNFTWVMGILHKCIRVSVRMRSIPSWQQPKDQMANVQL